MKTLLLSLFIIISATLSSQEPPTVKIISFEDLKKDIDNAEGIVIYNFWATWCKPCVEELPYFEKINKSYAKKGVKVVLVSLDFARQYHTQLLPYLEKKKLKSEIVLLDTKGDNSFIDKISTKWSGSIPATLIVEHSSKTYNFYEKQFDSADEIEALIKPLLKN